MPSLLRYTGNPFVDVGVAAIAAFEDSSRKRRPEDVDIQHLIRVANFLKDIYTNLKTVQGQLTTLFPNSGFTQAAFKPPQKAAYADRLLYGFLPEAKKLDVPCFFYPEKPAYVYAHRQFMPLLP